MATADNRPNPDELLSRVQAVDAREHRGRLKVFFGASPGVGKTYTMLEAARARQAAGIDVVAGYVETHGRADTEAKLAGFKVLPRRTVDYKGAALTEFDLDAALALHPGLLLVDELAHTNAPGSRHAKRWQDVLELVEAGIDVYSTLNVQHLESLNDVVAQVTGVVVRETVPDSVLDEADEIELVDLPAPELLKRLEEGKIYIPEQAGRAARSFFRPGNLIALREMALRRTADRVDAQMRDYRRDHSIGNTWPVTDRLMVCVGRSPFSAQLVRATARLAARLEAGWIAAYVERPGAAADPEPVRARILETLRLAEQLGGRTVTLSGAPAGDALLRYARTNNVSKIVVGKPREALWRRLLRGSLVDDLLRDSGDIEIYAIHGGATGEEGATPPIASNLSPATPTRAYWLAAVAVAVCTAVCLPLRPWLEPANLVMVYLLGVVAVAFRFSRRIAFFTSVLSVAAFDYFCVPPYYTLAVADYEYLVTFAVMLTVALVVSSLTVRTRDQAARAVDREARTQALYGFTRELAAQERVFDVATRAAELTSEAFRCPTMILLPEAGRITFRRRTSTQPVAPPAEEGIAQWVFDHEQKAGQGTGTLSAATALYLPLKFSGPPVGVLAIVPANPELTSSPEQLNHLEIFASQAALAMERTAQAATVREAELRMRTEEMRSSLLSAVSHDLRTPLASITGAATSLLDHGDRLLPETRRELLESIADEAERLGRLVNNLLEMTRLESGAIELRRDWHSIEEITGATLRRLAKPLAHHVVKTSLPATLPLVKVDDVLIEQLMTNLLENAAKYTPPGSEIEIAAQAAPGSVVVEVRDRGPGFGDRDVNRLFEKFYRGRTDGARGVGLGLAIAQAIVRAHRGEISALNRPGGGATIRFSLPAPPMAILKPEEEDA